MSRVEIELPPSIDAPLRVIVLLGDIIRNDGTLSQSTGTMVPPPVNGAL